MSKKRKVNLYMKLFNLLDSQHNPATPSNRFVMRACIAILLAAYTCITIAIFDALIDIMTLFPPLATFIVSHGWIGNCVAVVAAGVAAFVCLYTRDFAISKRVLYSVIYAGIAGACFQAIASFLNMLFLMYAVGAIYNAVGFSHAVLLVSLLVFLLTFVYMSIGWFVTLVVTAYLWNTRVYAVITAVVSLVVIVYGLVSPFQATEFVRDSSSGIAGLLILIVYGASAFVANKLSSKNQ